MVRIHAAEAASASCGGGNKKKKKERAAQVSTAAASPEELKAAALESQGSEGGMVESPIDEAAMASGKKKRRSKKKKKKGAGPIPPAAAPPEVSKPKVGDCKSPIPTAGGIKGRRRRRRRRPAATAAPPKERPAQGRIRGKATVRGGPNTKRSSGKFKAIIKKVKARALEAIIKKREARLPEILGYLLVLQWPGGIEKSGRRLKGTISGSNEPQCLYLHGLWPLLEGQDDTYERISEKNGDYLQLKLSSEDRKHLDLYFPSIIRGRSNLKFWRHEWMRHGKAAESKWKSLDPTNYKARYLEESVSIFLKYRQKIENALHGLQAKMKDPEAHDIVDEIHREIGHRVKIQAFKHEGRHYLYQIHLSLDANLSLQDHGSKGMFASCEACDEINIPKTHCVLEQRQSDFVSMQA